MIGFGRNILLNVRPCGSNVRSSLAFDILDIPGCITLGGLSYDHPRYMTMKPNRFIVTSFETVTFENS